MDILFEEENGSKTMYLQGPFAVADRVDGAGRIFSAKLLEREVTRYNEEFVKQGLGFVELGHGDIKVNAANICCLIVSLTQEGNQWVGKAKILDTLVGKTARNLVESGVKTKVSFYGVGTVQKVDDVFVVQDDYKLIGFSLVPEVAPTQEFTATQTEIVCIKSQLDGEPDNVDYVLSRMECMKKEQFVDMGEDKP